MSYDFDLTELKEMVSFCSKQEKAGSYAILIHQAFILSQNGDNSWINALTNNPIVEKLMHHYCTSIDSIKQAKPLHINTHKES